MRVNELPAWVSTASDSVRAQAASDVVTVGGMEPKDKATPPDARAQHRAFVLEHVMNEGLTIDQAAAILTLDPNGPGFAEQLERIKARREAPDSATAGKGAPEDAGL